MQDDLIRLTQDLIAFQTTKDRPDQQDQCLHYIEAYFRNLPVVCRRYMRQDVHSMVVTFDEGKTPKLFLNGHIDVVPAEPEQYRPRIDGGRLYGRGANDMKGQIAVFMDLMRRYSEQAQRPSVGLMLVGDEEVGGRHGTAYLLEEGYRCEFFLAGEPTALRIGNKAKGVLRLTLRAHGKASHAARPWEGVNAIEVMLRHYPQIRACFPSGLQDSWDTTMNFGLISGGRAINQIPDLCTLQLDIRYVPEDKPRELIQRLRERAPDIEVLNTREDAPVNTDSQHPYVRTLADAIQRVSGSPAVYLAKNEASDAKHAAQYGLPAIVFGPLGEGNHGLNEWVSIASLTQYHRMLETFITALP